MSRELKNILATVVHVFGLFCIFIGTIVVLSVISSILY
jgi:hypothetical protein